MAAKLNWERKRAIDRNNREWDEEIKRQNWHAYHPKGCACWGCIGRLQASVVQSYVRRMREAKTRQ